MSSTSKMDGPSAGPVIKRYDAGSTSQSSPPVTEEETTKKTTKEKAEARRERRRQRREIPKLMQELLIEWVKSTEDDDVQKKIGLDYKKDAGKLFRDVAEIKGKKRLFVCCDGTWQNAVGTIRPMSNVAKLARSVYRVGGDSFDCGTLGGVPQLAYYSSGIGGNSIVGIDGLVAAATGKGFTNTVLSAYCFISNNYNGSSQRDDIILVGYSRGAFAMRCLAQFISDVGLLRRSGLSHLGMFWKLWLNDEKALNKKESKLESKKKGLESLFFLEEKLEIKVLAEWDPVKSLVWPSLQGKKRLANMNKTVPSKVKNAFVAMSLNENRWSFKPVVWEQHHEEQSVCQCAFLGGHSDVGGGSIDAGLSTISLFWMVASIENACDARFDNDMLSQFILPERVRIASRKMWLPRGQEICLTTQALSEGNVTGSSFLWRLPHILTFGVFFDGNRSHILKSAAKQEQTAVEEPGHEVREQEGQAQEEITQGEVEQSEGREQEAEHGEDDQKENNNRLKYVRCELEIHQTVKWILDKCDNSGTTSLLGKLVDRILRRRGGGTSSTALKGFIHDGGDKWKLDEYYLKEAKLMPNELDMVKKWVKVADKTQSSLEYLRSEKRKEHEREAGEPEGNLVTNSLRADTLPLEAQNDMGPDEDILNEVKEWSRWRGAVENEARINKSTSLIKCLGPLYENERENKSENKRKDKRRDERDDERDDESGYDETKDQNKKRTPRDHGPSRYPIGDVEDPRPVSRPSTNKISQVHRRHRPPQDESRSPYVIRDAQ